MVKGRILKSCWINVGLYKFSPELFFKWDRKPFSLEKKMPANNNKLYFTKISGIYRHCQKIKTNYYLKKNIILIILK